jgi:O-antigen/teichoic acid export membrane protein
MVLFQSLWRVSFPAMSQLLAAGEDPRPLLERASSTATVATALVLAPCAASSPMLVPAIFGEPWHRSGAIVAISCVGLIVSGPISVATAGYLYAVGDAAAVLRATAVHGLAWVATALVLLPWIGPIGIGVGLLVGSSIDAVLLARPAARRTGARLLHHVAPGTAIALVGVACGISVGSFPHSQPLGGVIAGVTSFVVCVAALFAARRDLAIHLMAVTRRALTSTPASGGA